MSVGVMASEKLGPTSTTSERVMGLVEILDVPLVARAAGVSPAAVRKWMEGTEPRAEPTMTIDDLRSIVIVLLEAGFEPARIRSWFLSRDRDWLKDERPIDRVSHIPLTVLSAANDAATIYRFGPEAGAHGADRTSPSPDED